MRILMVSFYFSPYNAVGALRPTRMAEQLLSLGHDIHVLSAGPQPYPEGLSTSLPATRITRTRWSNVNAPVDFLLGRERVATGGYADAGGGSGLLAALGALYRAVLHVPDAQTGWRAAALRGGRRLMRDAGPFDLIYASAPPFSGLMVAAALARESGLPWVAELRDLWADNHDYRHGTIRRALDCRTESRVLASAAGLVTVSEPLAQALRKRHPAPCAVVPNGYDTDRSPTPLPAADTNEFRIAYTGSLYPAQDVAPLLEALVMLGEDADALRLEFCGRNLGALRAGVEGTSIAKHFHFSATVSHDDALARQRAADALLFVAWTTAPEGGILTSKLYEYLGARRPILAVGGRDSDTGRMVVESGSGFASREPREIAAWLRAAIRSKAVAGRSGDLPPEPIREYSRARQALKLDRFLRELRVGGTGGS